ncbi:unnamed protein product [Microthlaspi erraticum]|uniref:Uncharacterized protein n=1 Tax=Microthlaspi erraticum TaxID=1685480 RepID=A0A6D2K3X1_9BRAS|nr:unnamed protein product [Microthlaspi erraticum]
MWPPPWLILVISPLHLETITFFLLFSPNLKLPLLTLTTNGVIPLLGSPFFPQLSLSDCPLRDISSASDLPSSDHPLQIGLHLKPSLLHCLIHPQPFSSVKRASLTVCHPCHCFSLKYLKCIKDYKELEL